MKSLLVVCLVVASFALCGCFDVDLGRWFFSEELSEADIPGRYVVKDGGHVDILELHRDNTFTHVVIDSLGDTTQESGIWEFAVWAEGRYHVRLESYHTLFPRWKRQLPWSDHDVASYSLGVERVLGKTRICVNDDLTEFYFKLDEQPGKDEQR